MINFIGTAAISALVFVLVNSLVASAMRTQGIEIPPVWYGLGYYMGGVLVVHATLILSRI